MSRSLLKREFVTNNLWRELSKYTDARIGQGRAGVSQTTRAHLEFQADHALARDAIHIPLDCQSLEAELNQQGISVIQCESRVSDRGQYLQRPDLGRRLSEQSKARLIQRFYPSDTGAVVSIIVADGLSSTAVQSHAAPMVGLIAQQLQAQNITFGPVCLVRQGRVAIGDEIGAIAGSKLVVLLIGERPGLSSPDSLGIYLTYDPKIGRTDADRNCLSNIRPAGMSYQDAVDKLMWLINESLRRRVSGVMLKDESGELVEVASSQIEPSS